MVLLSPSPRERHARRMGFVLMFLLSMTGHSSAETAVSKENQVKALFLFNFAQFIQWPSSAFAGAKENFCIGILGEDPFDTFLDETVRGEKIGEHPLVIRRYDNAKDIKGCQILFISRSEAGRMDGILAGLKGKSILTVGDSEGFIKNGGMVLFFKEGNKVHFKINPRAAKGAKLAISSKVLRLAQIARPDKD